MADYLEISDELRKHIIAHYSRPEIMKAIMAASENKEVVGSFGGVGYAKRPDTLEYENDITNLVKKGITSFHVSEETWRNPLELAPGTEKKKLDQIRIGWDLLIDIDSPHWEISKLITHNLVQEIKKQGVTNVSVKFSGNKGFHIGIPQESFPQNYHKDFPDMPRKIASYLLHQILEKTKNEMLAILKNEWGESFYNKAEHIFKKPKEQLFEVTPHGATLKPLEIIEIDTLLISTRHLYRMVYAVNEKSGLVSIPINPDKVLSFQKDIAKIENNIFSRFTFMDRNKSIPNEAKRLCIQAIDNNFDIEKMYGDAYTEKYYEKSEAQREYEDFTERIPENYFPESIQKLLAGGFSDGKKRALFVLKNFLHCAGWTYDEIEKRMENWNQTHPDPLRETIIKGQLLYLKSKMKSNQKVMPPNFSSVSYYVDIIGDLPEYKKAKNPFSLAMRLFTMKEKQKEQEEKRSKKENKQKVKEEKVTRKKEK